MKFLFSILALVCFALPAFADNDLQCQVISNAIAPTVAQATDDYINLADGSFGTSTTADDEFTVPTDMIAWGLRVDIATAPGGTDTYDVYVVDDAANTVLHCEILGTATSCEDMSFAHRPLIVKGSDLMVLVDTGDGTGAPDANAELRFSFCLSKAN